MLFTLRVAASLALMGAPILTNPAKTAQIMAESGQPRPGYAGIADRVLASPILLDATITRVTRLKGADIVGLAPGLARFYLEADVAALIRGPAGVPARVAYVADVPLDPRGKVPRLKKQRVLLFARPAVGQPGAVQLTSPDAQRGWTPELDALVRSIARDVVSPDAPPAITGIGNAFHVAGSLPGEGETQIFLTTADARPVSLSILRRPGEEKRWAVALAEIVDEAAGPPQRDTFLWYRLACGLPPSLPDRALSTMAAQDAALAQEDYRFVLTALGPCGR